MNGLTSGTAYRFTVTATNELGTSPSSAISNSVTAKGAPAAPTGVSVTPGNGQATVSWTAPAWNGGSAITDYSVSLGGQTCSTSRTSCVVTGLTNGQAATGTVTATNAYGTSAGASVSASALASAPSFTSASSASASAAGAVKASVATSATVAPSKYSSAWLSASGLPSGVTFTPGTGTKANTGTLGGTAPGGGIYTFTITAANAVGVATVQTFTLRVLAFADMSPTTSSMVVGSGASVHIATTDPSATITSGTLPAGLSLSVADGVATISGTPTTGKATATAVKLTATDGMANATWTVAITVNAAPAVTATGTTSGLVHAKTAVSLKIAATGFPAPTITVSNLPAGLSFAAGKITGKASTAGSYVIHVAASNDAGSASIDVSLSVG